LEEHPKKDMDGVLYPIHVFFRNSFSIPLKWNGKGCENTKEIIGVKTLANIKSQIKRNRQNEKRRLRNRDFRGAARTAVKGALTAFETAQETQASVMAAVSALDKAAQKGAIHPRNASRRKGRLMKRLSALGLQPASAAPREPAAPVVEKKEAEKKPVKVKEAKPKEEAVKKPAAKKTAEKKTAAKKSTAKK
jgi:small subunit ribosomal protein S20